MPRHGRTKIYREARALQVAQHRLSELLERTTSFQHDLFRHLSSLQPYPQQRCVVAFQSGILAVEHSDSILILLKAGFQSSAFGLLRPQFESLLRGVWLLHGATDDWVVKLSQTITVQNAQSANDAPMIAEMLTQLVQRAPLHQALVAQLAECHRETGKALSNYLHGGLHALSRSAAGYPPQLLFNVMRISNAVTLLSGQLLVVDRKSTRLNSSH